MTGGELDTLLQNTKKGNIRYRWYLKQSLPEFKSVKGYPRKVVDPFWYFCDHPV